MRQPKSKPLAPRPTPDDTDELVHIQTFRQLAGGFRQLAGGFQQASTDMLAYAVLRHARLLLRKRWAQIPGPVAHDGTPLCDDQKDAYTMGLLGTIDLALELEGEHYENWGDPNVRSAVRSTIVKGMLSTLYFRQPEFENLLQFNNDATTTQEKVLELVDDTMERFVQHTWAFLFAHADMLRGEARL